jgi:hypothetical protein
MNHVEVHHRSYLIAAEDDVAGMEIVVQPGPGWSHPAPDGGESGPGSVDVRQAPAARRSCMRLPYW